MHKITRPLLALLLAVACCGATVAQEAPAMPKILEIMREYTKPGKSGAAHEKTESLIIQAMARAKWPTHYFALSSLSGKSRALFLTRYDSLEAWEKDGTAVEKNTALSAALDHADQVDGDLLDETDQSVWIRRDDLSLRPKADMSHMRFMEISSYHVRPGHAKEWDDLVKAVKAGYEKSVPDAHWGAYELLYGGDGGSYVVLTARASLSEVDRGFENDKLFAAAIGEDGMKKLQEGLGAAVDSIQHQLFAFSPAMSYVDDAWIKADPDFWKPKTAKTPAAKPAADDKKDKP
jgi:hypothetical protein